MSDESAEDKKAEDKKLEPKEALVLAAMTMISVDGDLHKDEMAILKRIVKDDNDTFERMLKIFEVSPILDCIEKVKGAGLSDDQKYCIVANLIDIGYADGKLKSCEHYLIQEYISRLGVADTVVRSILEVTHLKYSIN